MFRDTARSVWVVAGLHAVLLLAVSGRYGFHRDELYFLEAGQHLALGYVDQPPLVPLLARLQTALLGVTPTALRVVPAVVSAGSVVLAGALARELGGSRRAQLVAAAAVAGAVFVLATGHLLSTSTIDFAIWLALLLIVVRLLRTDDPRWWVPYGAVAGVGLWNKHLVVLATTAVLTGLLVERRRDLLGNRWILAGGALALLLAAPNLVWQAANGWPQLEMAGALQARLGSENRLTLLPLQLVLLGPLLIPLAVAGARWLWSSQSHGRALRPLLWSWAAALLVTLVSGGRPYYPLPALAVLVIAGAVRTEASWPRLGPTLVVANGLLAVPLSLPVLPLDVLADTPLPEVNDTLAEQVGWPELAITVADVIAEEVPADRPVVLLAGTYGEAGALDLYGPGLGLPPVHSGHNSYWHWRRPHDDRAVVVAVRMSLRLLDEHFTGCRQVASVHNAVGVDNEARGAPITVCDGLRRTWDDAWPALRHYD